MCPKSLRRCVLRPQPYEHHHPPICFNLKSYIVVKVKSSDFNPVCLLMHSSGFSSVCTFLILLTSHSLMKLAFCIYHPQVTVSFELTKFNFSSHCPCHGKFVQLRPFLFALHVYCFQEFWHDSLESIFTLRKLCIAS